MWQILADQGFKTASVAFPFARPGAAWPGHHVDERIAEISGVAWEDWPLPLDVGPGSLREVLREVRVHTADVPRELLAPFACLDTRSAERREIAAAIARASTVTAVSQAIAGECRPDFLAIHLDWPSTFARALGSRQLPTAFRTLFDGAIRNFRALVDPQSMMIVVSPGSLEGPGFIAVHQPGSTGGRGWASLRDITPTILEQFGLRDENLSGVCLSRSAKALRGVETNWCNAPAQASSADCLRIELFGHVVPAPPPGWPAPKLLAEAELILEQDPELAAEKVLQALHASPHSPQALALGGLLAFAKGDVENLETYAEALAAIDENSLRTTMLRAGVHVLRKQRAQAAPLLRRIQTEGNRDDRLKVAAAWLMLGSRSEAEKLLQTIVDEDPYCVPALLALASQKARRPFDAEQLLRRVVAIEPSHAVARTALADVLTACGRSAEAQSVREAGFKVNRGF